MIAFKDFVPKDKTKMLALSRKYESVDEAVDRANKWIDSEGVAVVNVETVLLPGIKSAGKSDAAVAKEIELSSLSPLSRTNWIQVVRVWYRG